jgi:diadenosine tetraphosphate (Ap4A) HIT family hydrolase
VRQYGENKSLRRTKLFFAIWDKYPVSKCHALIIPYRHSEDYFSMTQAEREDADHLLFQLKDQILQSDPTITGFNIGMNCGISAGQSIMHAHIHVIPRRIGDTPNPSGGVRGTIPEKMSY